MNRKIYNTLKAIPGLRMIKFYKLCGLTRMAVHAQYLMNKPSPLTLNHLNKGIKQLIDQIELNEYFEYFPKNINKEKTIGTLHVCNRYIESLINFEQAYESIPISHATAKLNTTDTKSPTQPKNSRLEPPYSVEPVTFIPRKPRKRNPRSK